ncbi:hypothetical protein [Nocardioides caldifontis]|uniref:hypothetical protein n=1 Tax=Nocardioides caldifontis TaxID=2588938 RepID=UPI0011DF370A|nr:hypothetical protein [Nocardioides caldifontis]
MSTVAGYVVAVTEPPTIVCPEWCVIPTSEHVAELSNHEGLVIHWSEDAPIRLSRSSYVDGTVDPTDPPLLHIDTPFEAMPLDEAEAFARRILAAVNEARS